MEIYFEIQIWGDFKIVIGCMVVLTLQCASDPPGGLRLFNLTPTLKGGDLVICISNKFSDI